MKLQKILTSQQHFRVDIKLLIQVIIIKKNFNGRYFNKGLFFTEILNKSSLVL